MTRETKVGMAVACSFLCLVMAVVVMRMRPVGETEPTASGSAQVAQGDHGSTTAGSGLTPTAGPTAQKEPGVFPAVYNQPGDSLPVTVPTATPSAVKGPPPGAPPLAPVIQPEVSPPPIPATPKIEAPTTPALTPPASVVPPSVPAMPAPAPVAPSQSTKVPDVPVGKSPPPTVKPKEATTPPAVAAAPTEIGLPMLPPAPTASSATPAAPESVAQQKKLTPQEEQEKRINKELQHQVAAAGQTEGAPVLAPGPAIKGTAPTPDKSADKAVLAPAKDLVPPSPGFPAPPAPAPLPNPARAAKADPLTPADKGLPVAPAPAVVAKETTPTAPSAAKAPEVTLNSQLMPTDPPPGNPGRTPGAVRPGEAPTAVAVGPLAADDAPPGSRTPVGLNARVATIAAPPVPAHVPENNPAPLPALGAAPAGTSAPIAVPMPPTVSVGPAKVAAFDVETVYVKPGDNTLADLSKRIYGSEKYAPALLQFNREFPTAGDSLRSNPPQLVPGQPIAVPPTHILEQARYASAPPIGRAIAATPLPVPVPAVAPASATPIPAVAVTPPVPAVPNPVAVAGTPPAQSVVVPPRLAAAPAVPAVSNPPSAAGTRVYTVQGNGQFLFEIARQTLGDGNRWPAIYRLNPDIRPELAIPGGTALRLPADARVGS